MRRREARRTAEPRRLAAGQRQRSKYNCLRGGGARVPPGAPLTCSRPAAGLKGQAGDAGPAHRRPRPTRRPRSPLAGCPRKARKCGCPRSRVYGLGLYLHLHDAEPTLCRKRLAARAAEFSFPRSGDRLKRSRSRPPPPCSASECLPRRSHDPSRARARAHTHTHTRAHTHTQTCSQIHTHTCT